MVVVLVVEAILVVVSVLLAMAALYWGLLGAFGILRVVRCHDCGKLGWASANRPVRRCIFCRHEGLRHPTAVFHHVHVDSHAGASSSARRMHTHRPSEARYSHGATPR